MTSERLSTTPKRVLLLFGNSRAGLAIARSMSEMNCDIYHVRTTRFKTEIDYSKSIRKSLYLGDVFSDFHKVLSALSSMLVDFDIILPVNDAAYELVFQLRGVVKKEQIDKIPEETSYRLVSDKFKIHSEFSDLFSSSEIKLNEMYRKEVEKDAVLGNFPFYSKPRVSTAVVEGCVRSFGVKKIASEVELARHVRNVWPVQCVDEPVIYGQSIGINVVASKGRLLGIGCTKRLHQPKDGGGSSYRISEKVSDGYFKIASQVVERVQWTGFMMIECIVADEEIFLIEINPRPWGSLPLTIFSGVDMPKLLYGDVDATTGIVVSKPGYRARNFAKDLKWLKNNPMSVLNWLYTLRYLFIGKERFDVEWLSDILPGLAQLRRPFEAALKKSYNSVMHSKSDVDFDTADSVTFVCKGNINRSIVSEKLVAHNWGVPVSSCGFICKPGRKISQNAETFLAKQGIDGSDHQSKYLCATAVTSRQVIVFERRHIRYVRDALPTKKVFLLSEIAKHENVDIKDPEFMCVGDANKVFDEIYDCLSAVYD